MLARAGVVEDPAVRQLRGVEAVGGVAVGGELQQHLGVAVLAGLEEGEPLLELQLRVQQVGLDRERRRRNMDKYWTRFLNQDTAFFTGLFVGRSELRNSNTNFNFRSC